MPHHLTVVDVAARLRDEVKRLRFRSPVAYVYNPLDYAWVPHEAYLQTYGQGTREIILLGMNPGPWGMAQTGVPFGEVQLVQHWLKIKAPVRKPAHTHPRVPVLGFGCHRREVSGQRLWGWAKDTFTTPKKFFDRFFVANYCPLMFLDTSGRNRTPDHVPARHRERLLQVSDAALRDLVTLMQPKLVIGVGGFAESRAKSALEGLDVTIGRILHPSPASPLANNGWAKQATAQLARCGVRL